MALGAGLERRRLHRRFGGEAEEQGRASVHQIEERSVIPAEAGIHRPLWAR